MDAFVKAKTGTVLYMVLWATGLVIALAIPERPLDFAPFRTIVAMLSPIIPAIARVGEDSPIPQVAQVYWATMCLWAALWVPVFFTLSDEQVMPRAKALRPRIKFLLWPLVAILVFVFVIFMPFNDAIVVRRMLGSVWGLAVIGSSVIAGVPLMIRQVVAWWRYIPLVLKKHATNGER